MTIATSTSTSTRAAATTAQALFDGPDGWLLDPDGAAVHPVARTAVVADVHLGYEWARGSGGDCLPAHSLAETLAKLGRVLERAPIAIDRLVVAGDLVESRKFCARTRRDVVALTAWLLDRGVELVSLLGNHDPPRRPAAPETLDVGGWTVAHGHRRVAGPRTVSGHHHPVLRAAGLTAPCFVVGNASILLPAFSPNAAGVSLAGLGLSVGPDGSPLRCVAAAGGALLDFGPVSDLLRALRS